MSSERYQQARRLFHEACERPVGERDLFLDGACGSDLELRAQVAALLEIKDNQPEFLRQPIGLADRFIAAAEMERTPDRMPAVIGHYRIVRVIGEGGMGTVYEAEQENPQRRVALKIVRPGVFSSKLQRRFDREVSILGRLHHPGIAQIFEAGVVTTANADGQMISQQFFAMELIQGRALNAYVEQTRLPMRDRLALLAEVCDAVHYGHQRGVVHCDLKPANIVVDDSSGKAHIKVIDFGVARSTDADMARTTMQTAVGQIVGTLAYMSPEQVSGDRQSVDRRSDIYSLGVIAFELLAGRLPYDLNGTLVPEAVRIVTEEEPSRLGSVDRAFRGDVETIVAKALSKEPARRYQSASEFAADILRFLRDEPIVARPPSTRYQLVKFVRRHTGLVAGVALAFVLLTAGVVGTSVALVQAKRAEKQANDQRDSAVASHELAERETRKALRASTFMNDVLASAAPSIAGAGRAVTVADVLERAEQYVAASMKEQPDLEMQVRWTLGKTYLGLGLYAEAERNLDRALQLATLTEGPDHESTLRISDQLAWSFVERYEYPSAERIARPALQIARRMLGDTHPCTQSLIHTLGCLLSNSGDLNQSEMLFRELAKTLRTVPDADRELPLSSVLTDLGGVLLSSQRWTEARDCLLEAFGLAMQQPVALEMRTRQTGDMSVLLEDLGLSDESELFLRKLLADQTRVLGRSHSTTLATLENLGAYFTRSNDLVGAIDCRQQSLNYCRSVFDGDNRGVAILLATIGQLQARSNLDEDAKTSYAESIAMCRRLGGLQDRIAHAWWREAVIRTGLGLHRRWGSEAIRMQACRQIDDELMRRPTTSFELDELDWTSLQFQLTRWVRQEDAWDSRQGDHTSVGGGLAQLHELADPVPGLYQLNLDVPRRDAAPLHTDAWMLVAPWTVQFYKCWAQQCESQAEWDSMIWAGPRETRRLPAISLANWWEAGFGPYRCEYWFALAADADLSLPAGGYRLLVDSDDGVRVWIDDTLVINSWIVRGRTTDSVNVQMDALPHHIRVEYFQQREDAKLWVRAEPLSAAVENEEVDRPLP